MNNDTIGSETLSRVEKEKRHIVSRMYQATYGMLQICPEETADAFKQSIANFEEAYPELAKLLKESPYHHYAVENMSDIIRREQAGSYESRMGQCSTMMSMIEALVKTPPGQQSANEMLEKLRL